MKAFFISLISMFFFISGCNKVPDTFKAQIMKFLDEGARLESKGMHLSYIEFRQQFSNVKAAYDLTAPIWPESVDPDARRAFDHALQSWSLTLELWTLKNQGADMPTEPDINGFKKFCDFMGVRCNSELSKSSYENNRFLPFEENIAILLSMGDESFKEGRNKILQIIK